MSYVILNDELKNYVPIKGLEGPFSFTGRVLYYDSNEGKYWDPKTDFYVDHDEMNMIHDQIYKILSK